jgi:replicative DNA helicase
MADVGKGLISKIIDDNDIQTAIAAGIRASWFEDEENRSVFSFMLDYHSRYGKTATAQALKDEYPNYRLRTTNEPYEYYIDRIFVQHERAILSDTVIEASAALEQDDIKLSRDALSRGLQRLGLETSILSDVNVVETYRDRYEDYLEAREHVGELSGISTGFPTLDMLTGGFQDEQFVVLGGAPKQGKSFMLMEMAIGAQFANCKVLFVSFEMSKREQLARYDASTCGVNASHLLRGTTTDKELKKLRKEMALRKHMQPFIISTDISATTTVSGLAAKVEEHDPDIVFVDGLYLMDNEIGAEPGSPRAFTAISRSLKRLAQRLKMPIVGTTQALTGKMKGNEVTMHSLGWCVDTKTEILTSTGWKTYETLEAGDLAFTLNHDSGRSEWQPVESVQVFAAEQRRMISMQSGSGAGHSSLTTPNHRWPVEHRTNHSIKGVVNRATGRRWATTETLLDNDQLILCGPHGDIPDAAKYTDSFVELVAWYWTEGSLMNDYGSVSIYQSFDINPGNSARIRSALLNEFGDIRPTTGAGKRLGHLEPPAWREDERKGGFFYLNVSAGRLLMDVVAGYEKVVSWDFLRTLTQAQLELFIQVSLLGDRTSAKSLGQASKARAESFQFACILAGRATSMTETVHKGYSSGPKWTTYVRNRERCAPVRAAKLQQAFKIETVQYDGVIWCPVTANQTWFARRCGSTYFTGNTSAWSQDADLILGTAKEDSGLLRFSVVAGRQVSSYDIPIAVNWDTSEFLEGNMEGESGGDSEDED